MTHRTVKVRLSVVVKELALFFYIWELPGSNFGLETDYCDLCLLFTECCSQVVSTPVTYSGGLGFGFQPGVWLCFDRISYFLIARGKCQEWYFKWVHGRYFLHPLQFVIHESSSHSVLCKLSNWKCCKIKYN